jgi:hypothetical protein
LTLIYILWLETSVVVYRSKLRKCWVWISDRRGAVVNEFVAVCVSHTQPLTENRSWKWPCVCCCGLSYTKECKFLMLVTWVNWASAINSMSCRICNLGCKLHKIVRVWHDHLIKGVVLVEDHIDRKYHGSNFSTSVPVLHQSSCKFYMYFVLGLCCTAAWMSLSVCHCSSHSAFARGEFCVQFQMVCSVEFSSVRYNASSVQQCSPTISTGEIIHVMHVSICFLHLWKCYALWLPAIMQHSMAT